MQSKYLKYVLAIFFFIPLLNGKIIRKQNQPKLTVIMVIDQFAHHYLPKLKTHLNFGIKHLLNNGIVYENAYHAHGFPETAPGHTALSTGTFPKDHGIVGNQWLTRKGKKHEAVADENPVYASFGPDNKADQCSCSPHHILVDGFSDQFCIRSTKAQAHKVFSVSLKARSAIGTANKVGKAIWFDNVNGIFTSSSFYFEKLPTWLTKFNEKSNIKNLTKVSWHSFYPENHAAYQFPFIRDYEHSSQKKALAPSNSIPIDRSKKEPYEWYSKTPLANQHILDVATACLDANLSHTNNDSMVLWVCLSPLDLAGHIFGPDAFELIDQIYHLDKQIDIFMKQVSKRFGRNNVLFVLTADHGIQPIPEISQKKGITNARRIDSNALITKMNEFAKNTYNLDDIIVGYECAGFVLDVTKKESLSPETLTSLLHDLKNILAAEPGIKHVWTEKELEQTNFGPHDLEQFYKNSYHSRRTGDLTCMPEPYNLITPYPSGCSHATPYDYDTHVPLVIYRQGHLMKKTIREKVLVTQLAGTLSRLLEVPRPSASWFDELPGIFNN